MFLPQQADRWQVVVLEWAVAFVTAGLLLVPRASLVLLSIFAVLATTIMWRGQAVENHEPPTVKIVSPIVIAAAVFLGWAFLSSTWSIDPLRSLRQPGLAALILMLCAFSIRAINKLDQKETWFLQRGLLCGFVIGLTYLVIEELTDRAVMRAIVNNLSFITPPTPSLIQSSGETVTSIQPSALNRHLTVLVVLIWPILVAAFKLCDRSNQPIPGAKVLSLMLLALTGYVIFTSDHDSSKLSLLVGYIAFSIAWFQPKFARYTITATWVIATLLMVPTVELLDRTGVKEMTILPSTGRDRIYIWKHTVRQFYKAPVLGIGAAGTPVANAQVQDYDKSFEYRLNRHAHNMYLQNSFELGLVGAVLLCLFGLLIVSGIFALNAGYVPFALAYFSTIAALCSVSYGLWQFWLIAVFAISVIALQIAIRLNSNTQSKSNG